MNNDIEIINEDIDEISPEAVAEGDYFMRCLKEGKDPFETKALNEAAMEANQKIINESAGDPVPMVGVGDEPIMVVKMFKNIYGQLDQKVYISNNHRFDRIFEADGIDNILECTIATSTLTQDDLKSEDTKVVELPIELYEIFLGCVESKDTFSDAIKYAFLTEDRDYKKAIGTEITIAYGHILKWIYQPSKQSTGWIGGILTHANQSFVNAGKNKNKYINYAKELTNNDLQKIYEDAVDYAYKDIIKHGGRGFDINPPEKIPEFLMDVTIIYDNDRLYNLLRSYMKSSYCMDEKTLYKKFYNN